MPKESEIQKQIIEGLQAMGAVVIRTNAGRMRTPSGSYIRIGERGTPDLVAFYRGKGIGIEIKRSLAEVKKWFKEAEKPGTREFYQKEYLDNIDRTGNISMIVSSFDEVVLYLKKL